MTVTDSKAYQTTGGTSLTGVVNAAIGDLVLATITTRDVLTIPEGWILVYESGIFDASGNGQRLTVLQQIADSTQISMTAVQASTQRLYLNLISISGPTNAVARTGMSLISKGGTYNAPDKNVGESIIWALSIAYWSSGQWVTSPNDLTIVDIGSANNPRQANFIDLGSGAATGRTFTQPTGSPYASAIVGVSLTSPYKTSGEAAYETDELSGVSASISWTENVPEGTSLSVKTSLDGVNWLLASNGEPIPQFSSGIDITGMTLKIKVEMATSNSLLTPSLSNLVIGVQTQEDLKSITLTMTNPIQNAADAVTVNYTGGILRGQGGAVAPFSEEFTPSNMVYKGDVNGPENVVITNVTAEGTLTRIYYTDVDGQNLGNVQINEMLASGT